MTSYRTIQPDPPAALRVRILLAPGAKLFPGKAPTGAWLPVPLLATSLGWVCVDDGQGPLWVMLDHIHRLDWPQLRLLEQLRGARN